jgi:hypothetical protein
MGQIKEKIQIPPNIMVAVEMSPPDPERVKKINKQILLIPELPPEVREKIKKRLNL